MNPGELLAAFTWRDALDFGLLFLVSYGLLRIVRGTRALPVLVALACLGVVAWLVRWLNLIGIASLLRYFFEYFIIILIVVFRQELRRMLLALGQKLIPHSRQQATRSAVAELVTGLERMTRARVGGTILIQGTIDLLEVVSDRGREVDAPLRADTLVALLVPHPANLSHDGAILVHDLQIVRAGVICPLTRRQDLDPRFGTRHRAAIGMSEESDALVLVVSEERGELRVVSAGQISPPVDAETVHRRIVDFLEGPDGGPAGPSATGEGVALEAEPSGAVSAGEATP